MSTFGPVGATFGGVGATFGDLEGGDPAPVGTLVPLELEVFDSAFAGPAVALADAYDFGFQDPSLGPGGFALRLQNDDAVALAACDFGSIVRFAIGDDPGPVFAGVIESKTVVAVASAEEVDEATAIKGRGTKAVHDSFVVYPERIDSPLVTDVRLFNFAARDFDASGWAAVDAVDLSTAEQDAPTGWPSPTSKKIRPGGSPTVDRDPEEYGVRKVFTTTGGDKTYRLFFTADDGVAVYLDGVLVASEVRPRMWQEHKSVDVRLRDGVDHLLALKGTNIDFPGLNYSWVLAALFEVASDGELGAVVVETDATWTGAQFGDTPPGFTAGRILEILRDEAVARGVIVPTLGFSATLDSDEVAWPVAPDVAFPIGLKGLGVLAQLEETYVDSSMAPDELRLDAWAHGTRGGPVGTAFVPGSNVTELSHEVNG